MKKQSTQKLACVSCFSLTFPIPKIHQLLQLLNIICRWQMMKCTRTKIDFYYDVKLDILTFKAPIEANWNALLKTGVKQKTLGYREEWVTYTDRDDNLFYYSKCTRTCQWEKPLEAVEISVRETYCTAYEVFSLFFDFYSGLLFISLFVCFFVFLPIHIFTCLFTCLFTYLLITYSINYLSSMQFYCNLFYSFIHSIRVLDSIVI